MKSCKRNILVMSVGFLTLACGGAHAQEKPKADKPDKPHIDLAFCIDTTGSMQGEIDAVKSKTREIVARLSGSKPSPVIRVGVVAFRDRGDAYVTKVFPFSENIDQVVKDVSSLVADGGGDTPEALNEALHCSLHDLKWSEDKKTVKQLFVIGDAGPHIYPGDYNWEKECKQAISRGIQINTVACHGLDDPGAAIFGKIAKLTDGSAENLTYKQEVVHAGGKVETLITSRGASYAVAGDGDAWREGAEALKSKGLAAPVLTTGHAASRPSGWGGEGAPYAAGASAGAPAAAAEYGYAPPSFASAATSRKESNLADIVLRKTKKALEEKMAK